MNQIGKCPHCGKDSLFTRGICPNCGLTSRPEERGKPDFLLDANGKLPSYTEVLEEEMTVSQKHGRILIMLCTLMIGLPLLAWTSVVIFQSQENSFHPPVLPPLAMLCLDIYLTYKLFARSRWARWALCLLAVTACIVFTSSLHTNKGFNFLTSIILFSAINLAAALMLATSRDATEFLTQNGGMKTEEAQRTEQTPN